MSPARDMDRGSPTSRELWVSLAFERESTGMLAAHLAVEEPNGSLLVSYSRPGPFGQVQTRVAADRVRRRRRVAATSGAGARVVAP